MDFDSLSDNAKSVGHAFFPTLGSEATFHMVESEPSEECQAALDELVEKGFATVEPFNQFGGVVYKPKASFGHLMMWAWQRAERGESIVLWRKKAPAAAQPPSR